MKRLRRYEDDGVVYPQTDAEDESIREVQLPPYPNDEAPLTDECSGVT